MASHVPDAWDDDYERVADQKKPTAPAPAPTKIASRAERRAQHAEANKALWNSAENPETFNFVDARASVPLKTDFKPAVTVLSRKPKIEPKPAVASHGRVLENGTNGATPDDDPDSEEEARREQERTFKQRQERARADREEKQRKYNEVRSRLFGSAEPDSGSAAPGRSSPTRPASGGRQRGARPGGRGRGGGGGGGGGNSSHASSTDQSPARAPGAPARQLFDPEYAAKPGSVYLAGRERDGDAPRETPHVRQPRGPDGSGRGGFGFAPRGARDGVP